MHLKVGDLAKRSGLTIRALRHYDEIGLLKPSAHSEGGHRLYNLDDVARLHSIQVLQQIGLPLNKIGELLNKEGAEFSVTIKRQIALLKHQITQAAELCDRLQLLQSRMESGDEPDTEDWLSMLGSMSTYGRYFSASELKTIFDNWETVKPDMLILISDTRNAMSRGLKPDQIEVQPLIRRWVSIYRRWMGGDEDLISRWYQMYVSEPAAQGKNGMDLEMARFVKKGVEARIGAYLEYLTADELQRLNPDMDDEWQSLAGRLRKLIQEKVSPKSRKAREAVQQWSDLVDRLVNHDQKLREKLLRAFESSPKLRAGALLEAMLQDFLSSIRRANRN